MADMERKGLGSSMSRMGSKFDGKPDPAKHGKGIIEGEGDKTTTITHHGDGSHTVDTGEGEPEHHASHLEAGAHLLHHMSGGDKHHIVHHDGMSATSHMIHENGEHEGPTEHNSADEAKQSLDKFFNEEAGEPAHEHDGAEQQQEPAYGAM